MSKIEIDINFDEIRERIDQEKKGIKPSVWADMLGVNRNVVTNVHGRVKQKPSLEYIVAVSRATGRSVDYLLWGGTDSVKVSDDVNFKDQTRGRTITSRLIELEKISPKVFDMVDTYITGAHEAAKATAAKWDGIERRSKERRCETKEDLGFERLKNGT